MSVWLGVCLKRDQVYKHVQPHTHTHTARTNSRGQDLTRGRLTSSGNNVILRVCVYGNVYLSECFSVFNIPGCSFLGNTVCFLWGDHCGLLVSMLSTPKHTPWSLAPLISLCVFSSLPFPSAHPSFFQPPLCVMKVSSDNSLPYLESFSIPCRSF